MSEILQNKGNSDNSIILSRPCRVMQEESEKDMFEEMDFDDLMNFGVDTVYGLRNPETQWVIIVSDLRRHNHGEYTVERGNIYGVKAIWSSLSKQKCIEKARQIAQAAG